MSKKKEKKIDLNNLEPGEKLKYWTGCWKTDGNPLHRRKPGASAGSLRGRKNSQAETRIGKTLQKQVNLVKLYGW